MKEFRSNQTYTRRKHLSFIFKPFIENQTIFDQKIYKKNNAFNSIQTINRVLGSFIDISTVVSEKMDHEVDTVFYMDRARL